MSFGTYLDVLRADSDAFAATVADTAASVPVPSCPGWTLGELARHLGRMQREAREDVLGLDRAPWTPPPDDGLADWLRQGSAALHAALAADDPERACATFAPPHTVGFWIRRMAHEVALHLWDARLAAGTRPAIDDTLARDGIDEVLTVFVPHQLARGRLAAAAETVALHASGEDFVLATAPPPGRRLGGVSGTAEAVLLLLWGRVGLDDARLRVDGDRPAVADLLGRSLTP